MLGINFGLYAGRTTFSSVGTLLHRFGPTIRALSFDSCVAFNRSFLLEAGISCPNLDPGRSPVSQSAIPSEAMTSQLSGPNSTPYTSAVHYFDAQFDKLVVDGTLRHLHLLHTPGFCWDLGRYGPLLPELHSIAHPGMIPSPPAAMLAQLTHLEWLEHSDALVRALAPAKQLRGLTLGRLVTSDLMALARLVGRTLESLRINDFRCPDGHPLTDEDLEKVLQHLPHLRRLALYRSYQFSTPTTALTPAVIPRLLARYPWMTELVFEMATPIPPDALLHPADGAPCPPLTLFDTSQGFVPAQLTDAALAELCGKYPHLRRLNLQGATLLTDRALDIIATGLRELETIVGQGPFGLRVMGLRRRMARLNKFAF
ncbi:hypothetical protein PAPYR_9559 [Paratrimastix pyriformis]|uniref:Uncharacterized protein n=1 Tax=Paratrimastix pyriformis TaxID=342808 RepID=A0ABQ8UDQ3_9EUKA|nr:hypothetical protein PAPYR_9559 [Paratrimastix pyriformis]